MTSANRVHGLMIFKANKIWFQKSRPLKVIHNQELKKPNKKNQIKFRVPIFQ
jgi:hypothetical protein